MLSRVTSNSIEKNYRAEPIRLENIACSRHMEFYRVGIAALVVQDSYLWDIARACAKDNHIKSINKSEFKEAPRQIELRGEKTSRYFAELEKKLDREYSSKKSDKLSRLIDNVFSERDRITENNSGLVYSVLWKLGISSERKDYEDLKQEGNLGLMNAAHKFDYKFGNGFPAFAYGKIESEIIRSIRTNRLIHIPDNVVTRLNRINREIAQTSYQDSRDKDKLKKLVAKRMGLSVSELENELQLFKLKVLISLDKKRKNHDGESYTLMDKIEDVKSTDFEENLITTQLMEQYKRSLPPRIVEMLEMRLRGEILEDIGDRFGITKERVRQQLNEHILSKTGVV